MYTVGLLAIVTVISVVLALNKRKPVFFAVPIMALLTIGIIKIALVPLPFWETVQFIFNLSG
ncbi:membrane protein [Pontibacillus halophilus JSM 076056 = DSM 19796]|uniref:Membrane protein n=1 Tax=Pontibacillus halophilus JSM 076056 = DSM 19796 TaxID=1385510 RepID=A0A0A5GL28_9BACI|nr:hypothetical protein [Pontibacillus halophilus]KGX91918.1 membrane protein [Pontibacillus halophilus JSM 076056 = DSM 19796]